MAGGINEIDLTGGTKLDRVFLGSTTDEFFAAPGGTTIKVTGSGIRISGSATFADTVFDTDPQGGGGPANDFTNAEGSLLIKPSLVDWHIFGDGNFINNGTVRLESAGTPSDRLLLFTGGPTFENNALLEMTSSAARLQLLSGSTFNNNSTGTIRVDLTNGTDVATLEGTVSDTFSNTGTIEVLSGELDVHVNTPVSQLSGSSLTGGTWRVIANTADAALDLHPADGTPITDIATGAVVALSAEGGNTASFPQLGVVGSVGGGLFAYGNVSLPVSGSMSVTGSLGGDGEFDASGGTVTFTGGTLDPSDFSGTGGTLSVNGDVILDDSTIVDFFLSTPGAGGPNDLVIVAGDLTLDGVLNIEQIGPAGSYRLFNYAGMLTDMGLTVPDPNKYIIDTSILGQVNLVAVPEPSTLVLAGLAMVAMTRHRRRRRNG